ncbi:hypothetical protein [Actinoplanes sp. NPDC048796]|uniref:hypothetical protein n=1 Tax=unclassified Actinoplanes TaxID=2626549 RepID=UPI0033CF6BB6
MRRTLTLAAIASLLVTGVAGVPAQAVAAPSEVAKAPDSVAYLVDTYGVTQAEAVRRLKVQAASRDLGRQLRQDLPDRYAGMWLDQKNGGELVVGLTAGDKSDVAAKLPSFVRLRTQPATYSMAQLEAMKARIEPSLGDGEAAVIDVHRNRLAVWTPGTATVTRMSSLTRLTAAEPGVVVARRQQGRLATEDKAEATTAPTAKAGPPCHVLICGPAPMRGGYRLDVPRDDGTTGPCTAGFNIRGSNGWQYIITAGHCFRGSNHTHIDKTSHNGIAVGYEDTVLTNSSYPKDYAISPYQTKPDQVDYWGGTPRNLVRHQCASSHVSCVSKDWPVWDQWNYEDILLGFIACRTGSADTASGGGGWLTGTYCGEVTDFNGGIVTNHCGRKGDSGGPLFSQFDNSAYGILHDGTDVKGPCYGANGTNEEWSDFTALSVALDDAWLQNWLNGGGDIDYELITSANG